MFANLFLSYSRLEQYKTGGGPNVAQPLTEVEMRMKGMMALSVDGFPSLFDSDDHVHEDPKSNITLFLKLLVI